MYPNDIDLNNAEKALVYGRALDNNNIDRIYTLLSDDVAYYHIDDGVRRGPIEVCLFMKRKRHELIRVTDQCQWEQSYLSKVSDNVLLIHFVCRLKAGIISFDHHCTQRLYFNDQGKINMIDFIDEPMEKRALAHFMTEAKKLRKRA